MGGTLGTLEGEYEKHWQKSYVLIRIGFTPWLEHSRSMGVSKNNGTPKMDGKNNGKPC